MAEYRYPKTEHQRAWIHELEQASFDGDLESTLTLRQCYLEGKAGLQADPGQALRYTKLAARQGDPRSMYHTAVIEYSQGRFDTSARWMIRSWRAGIREASFGLARAYAYGRGLSQDLERALDLLEEAQQFDVEPEQRPQLKEWVLQQLAARLEKNGQHREAVRVLESGQLPGTAMTLAQLEPENRKARLQQAADGGLGDAMYQLALLEPENSQAYFEQIRNAAKAGCQKAWQPLAQCYGQKGIHPDRGQAQRWKVSAICGKEQSALGRKKN